ncbi:MAG TPA: hypothetical protein VEV41_14285 [Terriglobales bacterium]|nr:hypothetical protein [Terriglobales bacterium]
MDQSRSAQSSFKQGFPLIALLLALAAMPACGGGSGNFIKPGPGPNNAMLNGQYAFAFSGENSNLSLIIAAGSFTADGNGHISNGLEDVTVAGSPGQSLTFSGTYSIGSDGRGTALINTSNGTVNWQFTLLNSSHALLIRFDVGAVTASGTIDKQDPTAFSTAKVQGKYVFGLSGAGSSGGALATAGIWTMDGAGTISNGVVDVNDLNAGVLPNSTLSGTYSVASNGRGTATVTTSGYVTQNFVFYVVDATDLKFVETDGIPAASGEVLQAAAPYTLASLNGGLAFTLGGVDRLSLSPTAAGGVITADGNGSLPSGLLDINDGGVTAIGSSISGTYSFDPTGRGIVNLASSAPGNLQFAIYPAQNRTIEMVEIDLSATMSGMAEAQTGVPFGLTTIAGPFAVNFTGVLNPVSGSTEEDITGQLNANGSGNLSGTLDINTLATRTQGAPLANSSYTMAANGRGTAVINIPNATFNMQTYQIDASTVLFLDVDTFRVLTGVIQKQQ